MIGVDEVGRGCWAGPMLVVAARKVGNLPDGLADSKVLTKARRERLYDSITRTCELGEGWVSATEIDRLGLGGAMRLAVSRALRAIRAQDDEEIIMDGIVNYCEERFINTRCEPRADAHHPIVSAASVYAKVTRDAYMARQDEFFPEYGFIRHVGYGTREHSQAIKKYGINELHRLSFTPIKALAGR